ncbi:MAG: VanW family protein [Armatimonadota bacterium]
MSKITPPPFPLPSDGEGAFAAGEIRASPMPAAEVSESAPVLAEDRIDVVPNAPFPSEGRGKGGGVILTALAAAFAGLLGWIAQMPPAEVEIAGYATSLNGRTRNQRHNAELAANSLDGAVIPAGALFSFNRAVKSWSADQGYRKAPVSYDGELVPAFGGGVCQTSTTLYNAVLRAGFPIVERHHHVFAPHYVPPGSDAAVAYPSIDLRFRNPYPWPVRVQASTKGDRLEVRLYGKKRPDLLAEIEPQILSRMLPSRITYTAVKSDGSGRIFTRNPGRAGYRVVTYRIFSANGQTVRRERLSDDTYPTMDRILQVGQE